MPSSWSTRLLSSAGSSSNSPPPTSNYLNQPGDSAQRERSRPRTPLQLAFDTPPTLRPERAAPSASRLQASAGKHTHNRSVSHPLPRIFGRKKSAKPLYHDTDVPLDDDLVPVLDKEPTKPARVISGKRQKDEDGVKVSRRCMCCDSRVNVPQDLDRFRCLACLTINELKSPAAGQKLDDQVKQDRPGVSRTGTFPGGLPQDEKVVPLSVQRTRAIIDDCLMVYFEARCKRQGLPAPPATSRPESPHSPFTRKTHPSYAFPIRPRNEGVPGSQLSDALVSSSPPDALDACIAAPISPTVWRADEGVKALSTTRSDSPRLEPKYGSNDVRLSSPGSKRKPEPTEPLRRPPPPPMTPAGRRSSNNSVIRPGELMAPRAMQFPLVAASPATDSADNEQRERNDRAKAIFRPLENYIVSTFGDHERLNAAFSTLRPTHGSRARSESNIGLPDTAVVVEPETEIGPFDGFSEMDAKALLIGELGENSSWWTGKLDRLRTEKPMHRKKVGEGSKKAVSSRSPNIDWVELGKWYSLIHSAGEQWRSTMQDLKRNVSSLSTANIAGQAVEAEMEEDILEGRNHAIRALLKTTENILKRPLRALKEPEELRFLLILLTNPSLYPASRKAKLAISGAKTVARSESDGQNGASRTIEPQTSPTKSSRREDGQHSGLLKRIFGLLANSSDNCHRYMINWFARLDDDHFVRTTDLVASFVTYRLARRTSGRPRSRNAIDDGGLIPDLSGSTMNTSAQLFAAMGLSGSIKKRDAIGESETDWATDWQIKAAAKLMSLLFAANNNWHGRLQGDGVASTEAAPNPQEGNGISSKTPTKRSCQLLHTSYFYNSLLDYQDMIADFKVWESKRDKFAFCQYPLLISMGAKIKILEYDARRQMEIKAREAYFDQVIRQRAIDGYFHLRVRRDCLVDDSLRQISEAVGAGQEELKKGLRVHFTGEEGVDAGGLRKEWFLMLIRDIFDPNHGLFVYDEDSNTCYFNPHSFETSDQYYLVGALLGLAIYNSTILDVALPPFTFRKLLAAAPSSATNPSNISSLTGTKGQMTHTIADLAEFRPSLAAGLEKLLDFDGDVEATFCRDFVAPVERYGTITNIPLVPNGEAKAVTNANRHEFVDAYIRYLLDTSVVRQFEPFKRGFFTVCAGNALSLFRAEEIELLVRGSDEALDVDSLRAVAVYENWRQAEPPHAAVVRPAEAVPVISWFWQIFAQATPERQRKLLAFMTGSDRIPAVGATNLILRIVAGGDGWGGGGEEERARFPVARTCFNMLVLWRYESRELLEVKLWRAVDESEGFGLK